MIDERVDNMIERLDTLEKEMRRVNNRLQCRIKREQLKLSEKLHIHDHAKNLEAEFEALTAGWEEPKLAELRKIIKYLVALVDNALGVKP